MDTAKEIERLKSLQEKAMRPYLGAYNEMLITGLGVAKVPELTAADYFAFMTEGSSMMAVIADLQKRLEVVRRYIERHPYTVEGFEAAIDAASLSKPLIKGE